MKLNLVFLVIFIYLSSAERANRLRSANNEKRNHRQRRNNGEKPESRSTPELPDDSATQREASATNYDLEFIKEKAITLLRSLDDIRDEVSSTQEANSEEQDQLLDFISASSAVVAMTIADLDRLDDTQSIELQSLSEVVDHGTDAEMRLRGRLMQWKKQWYLPHYANHAAIEIANDEPNNFTAQPRRLQPDSLPTKTHLHEEFDEESLLSPPSHLGSGLLSNTGHDDLTIIEPNNEGPAERETAPQEAPLAAEENIINSSSFQPCAMASLILAVALFFVIVE